MLLSLSSLLFRWDQVRSSVVVLTGQASGQAAYKVSRQSHPPNHLTDVPCGLCSLTRQCCEGGVISPSTCEYMAHWLSAPGETEEEETLF